MSADASGRSMTARSLTRAVSFAMGDSGPPDETPSRPETPARAETHDDLDNMLHNIRSSAAGTSPDVKLLLFQTGTFEDENLATASSVKEKRRLIHKYCQFISEHVWFTSSFMLLIAINVVLIAIETDLYVRTISNKAEAQPEFSDAMEHVEQVFTGLFLIEITIRLLGCPGKIWLDGWLVTDSFIVFVAVLDTWIFGPLESVDLPSGLQFLRAARAFKAFRAVRVLRILRFFRALRLIAEAMGEAFRQTLWIICVTFIATWCMSSVITSFMTAAFVSYDSNPDWGEVLQKSEEYHDFDDADNTGQTVPATGLFLNTGTLSNMVGLGFVLKSEVFWGKTLVPELLLDGGATGFLAGLFVIFSIYVLVLVFYNVVVGIFISSLIEAGQRDTKIMSTQRLSSGNGSVQQLKGLYAAFDKNGQGKLTFGEFGEGLKNYHEESISAGLQPQHAGTLYRHMDIHDSGGVSEEEFIVGCIRVIHSSRNENALIVMHQQQKILRDICTMDRTYTNEAKGITNEIYKAEHEKENGLKKLGEKARQLATHLLKTPKAAPSTNSAPQVQPGKTGRETAAQRIMQHLQENFQFETRLAETKTVLKDLSKGVDRAPPAFATSSLLRDVLREEIMPNLQIQAPQLARMLPMPEHAIAPVPDRLEGPPERILEGIPERGLRQSERQPERHPQFRQATQAEAANPKPRGWALRGTAALSAAHNTGRRWFKDADGPK